MIGNDDSFEKRAILFGIISDMINIAETYQSKEVSQIKDIMLHKKTSDIPNECNFIQDNIIIRTDVISKMFSRYQNKTTPNIVKIYNSVFNSIKLLAKNMYDSFSGKNKISLYVFSYYIVAHFYSLLTEDDKPLKNFKEETIISISKILQRDNLIRPVQNIINTTSSDILKKNKKHGDFADTLLMTIKNSDFENQFNEYVNNQNRKKIKKKEKKKIKKKEKEREKENEEEREKEKEEEKKEEEEVKEEEREKEKEKLEKVEYSVINIDNKKCNKDYNKENAEKEKEYKNIIEIKDKQNEIEKKEKDIPIKEVIVVDNKENTQIFKKNIIIKNGEEEKDKKEIIIDDLNQKFTKKSEVIKLNELDNNNSSENNIKTITQFSEDKNKNNSLINMVEIPSFLNSILIEMKETIKNLNDKISNLEKDKKIKDFAVNNLHNKISVLEKEKDFVANNFNNKISALEKEKDFVSNNLHNKISVLEKEKDFAVNNLNNKISVLVKEKDLLNNKISVLEKEKDLVANNLNDKISVLEKENKNQEIMIKSLNDKVYNLEEECQELSDNQIVFWGYLNLLSNGRDLSKSIVYYLYKFLNFANKEEDKNYKQLSRILKALNNENYDKEKINIDKDKLIKFLHLDFFLSRLFNNILHREIKFKSNEANKKLKLIPGYTFDDKFNNLILFINSTIKDPQIQEAIKQNIEDYKLDTEIMNHIKYEDKNLFMENTSKFETILKEKDILDVKEFLMSIKVDDNSFIKLCEEKKWRNYTNEKEEENLPKPIFYKDGANLSENN